MVLADVLALNYRRSLVCTNQAQSPADSNPCSIRPAALHFTQSSLCCYKADNKELSSPCESVCVTGYKANLVAAADSDARLETRLNQNQNKFNALSLDLAISQMPRLQVRKACCLILAPLLPPVGDCASAQAFSWVWWYQVCVWLEVCMCCISWLLV